jgi:hypothetical protein
MESKIVIFWVVWGFLLLFWFSFLTIRTIVCTEWYVLTHSCTLDVSSDIPMETQNF